MAVLLEVAVDSLADAVAAVEAGAGRVELNAAMELDGLTPSVGLVREVRRAVRVPLLVMIRPRAGDFVYDAGERRVMRADLLALRDEGADGFVFGILRDGLPDEAACRELVECAGGCEAVFHRAFDVVRDPSAALRALIDVGYTRVLTSGGTATAVEGAARIGEVRREADGRIGLLPGGGVRAANVAAILGETGCDEVHSSCRVAGRMSVEEVRGILGASGPGEGQSLLTRGR